MNGEVRVIGSFEDEERCVEAIKRLKEEEVSEYRAFSPIPCPEIINEVYPKLSRVRAFVLGGGIFGVLAGFWITLGTSFEWDLVAGGKPIASIPPYIIIAFELMILCGGIAAVLSFFLFGRMPNIDGLAGFKSRFLGDRWGLVVPCHETESSKIEEIFTACGAEEVTMEAAEAEEAA